jgi:uncharacterized protein (TIGR03067 family)
VNRLPERYRAAIVLFYLTGRTQDEVGRALGLSKDGAKKRLECGRALLRTALGQRGIGPAGLLASTAIPVVKPSAALAAAAQSLPARGGVPNAVSQILYGVGLMSRRGWLRAASLFMAVVAGGFGLILHAGQEKADAPKSGVAGSITKDDTSSAIRIKADEVIWGEEVTGLQAGGKGTPDATPPPATATELAKFQGTWVLVSSERDGRATSEEKNPYTLTFTGDKWKVHRGNEVAVEGTLRLVDLAATPKKFDLIKRSRLAPGTSVDYGIYDWKGDRLRYCTRNGPLGPGIDIPDLRPRDFTTRDGDGRALYLWKRAHPAAKASLEQPAWGMPRNGLRLGLYLAEGDGDGPARLMVVLENRGAEDLVINLGIMLGNGKKQVPMAIRLIFTDSGGRRHIVRPSAPRIAGRVDPFAVPLPAGCRYAKASRDVEELTDRLAPGRYRVRAEFVGKSVGKKDVNEDTAGLAMITYWTGTIQSDDSQVTLPAKPTK